MPRWRSLAKQHMRWSSPLAQAVVLCVFTFGLVLPVCCHRLLYSYYFLRSLYLDSQSDQVLRDSYEAGQEALRYWQGRSSSSSPSSLTDIPTGPELLVTVVTASRLEGRDYHYLLQVMRRLSALLRDCHQQQREPCAQVLVCDVESDPHGNEDAALLESHFPVVRRSPGERQRDVGQVNTFEREKRDYVFCLRKGWELARPANTVVLEDDALPRGDFFPVLRDVLSRRVMALHSLYVKLYHPERLQRYWNPEPYRLLEWLGLGLVGATGLLLLLPLCSPLTFPLTPPSLLFLSLFTMAAVELAGRHYLLELRRLSPQLYSISPATECCTPAMLYPGNASQRVAQYLDGSFCVKGNAKDMVLYHMARSVPGEQAHSLEPNLISHIGAFSSVRANPSRPKLLR
ncbi:post-GPI attachment to proteins factor 4 [Aplochiton taeniatus]